MANYWMVHSDPEIRNLVEEGEFLAIGFGAVHLGNLEGLDREQIRERVKQRRPEASPNEVGAETASLDNFVNEIKVGDWTLTSVSGNDVLIGLIVSKYNFVPSHQGQPHQRSVKWVDKVSRNRLSDSLSKYIGRPPTIFGINQHADEIRQLVEA